MTDAIQQRSRYQCALKMKNASCWGNSFLTVLKLRRLKFPVISICSTRKDVSMVIVAGRSQQVHSNKKHG